MQHFSLFTPIPTCTPPMSGRKPELVIIINTIATPDHIHTVFLQRRHELYNYSLLFFLTHLPTHFCSLAKHGFSIQKGLHYQHPPIAGWS
jgi:hypothetical protein